MKLNYCSKIYAVPLFITCVNSFKHHNDRLTRLDKSASG